MPHTARAAAPVELDLVDALVQLSFAVHEVLGALAAEHDVSVVQIRMLGVLRDRTPAMLELARLLSLEKSSVTGLVDRAQQRGIVERTRGRDDGRAVHVGLTPQGRRLVERVAAEVAARIDVLAAPLTARERAHLVRVASRVVVAHAETRGLDLRTD